MGSGPIGVVLAAAVIVAASACSPAAPTAGPPPPPRCGTASPTLTDVTRGSHLTIGTAYRSTFAVGDPCYEATALHDFASLTTEIGTMTNTVAPEPGKFDFTEADAVADVAARNGKDFQIHSVIWDPTDHPEWGIVPEWIRAQPPEVRHATMLSLITGVLTHYRGRASTATVVNEAFDQLGNLQPSLWWQTTGDDRFIVDAFRAARLAAPEMKLYYNDHSAETKSGKSDAIYALVEKLRAMTVPVSLNGVVRDLPLIDGMGFQTHMIGQADQPSTADMRANFQRFADLGLDVRFTEMDVRTPVDEGVLSAANAARQKRVYDTMATLCAEQRACTGITLWGFTDRRSWITDYPASFTGYGAANVYDVDYQRKSAWQGLADGLSRR